MRPCLAPVGGFLAPAAGFFKGVVGPIARCAFIDVPAVDVSSGERFWNLGRVFQQAACANGQYRERSAAYGAALRERSSSTHAEAQRAAEGARVPVRLFRNGVPVVEVVERQRGWARHMVFGTAAGEKS